MGEVSEVRKTFEDSLRKIDEFIEGMHAEWDTSGFYEKTT
jgi:hypothetical protein